MEELLATPLCCENHIDPQHEAQLRARLPSEAEAADVAAVFAHLSDSTRVKLLSMLAASDLCVCEMADLLGMSQPAVSHHLRILRQIIHTHRNHPQGTWHQLIRTRAHRAMTGHILHFTVITSS